ncbi:hypothetical protein HDV05_002321 [Chytridiales sp. JEL 0842]|nr:hypothetical protein HDV05_002321 [Chytridiales sp. JEL 0842]
MFELDLSPAGLANGVGAGAAVDEKQSGAFAERGVKAVLSPVVAMLVANQDV